MSIATLLKRYFSTFFDLILPSRCPLTGEIVLQPGMFSAEAWKQIAFITEPSCKACGLPFEIDIQDHETLCGSCIAEPKIFRQARSALVYDEISRKLILAFKHGDHTQMAPCFLPWLLQAGNEILDQDTILIPVPLHWTRLLKRRYNQAALLTDALHNKLSLLHWPDALLRVRRTPSQGHLSAKERLKNVRSAFVINKKYADLIKQKRVVLVDDVYTTGATVEECADVLYEAGAVNVDVLTLARVVRPGTISRKYKRQYISRFEFQRSRQ